ncbi:MAG: PIN domain-containing protein [Chloroflexi bacterium]|nr:PIN domain-containing protein [Chloroflexota bacterium]
MPARVIFIDSQYFIAISSKDDQWYELSMQAARTLSDAVRFVTTYDVLSEFLAAVSRGNPDTRLRAVSQVRNIFADDTITLVPQTLELFTSGLQLYASRPDKRYSLTDCISMTVMRDQNITEALTHDRDFENEGFVRLIR